MIVSSAVDGSTAIVGYLALFGGVGLVFVFFNLLLGRFLRPHDPHPEKQEIYECGEPAIGSSFVQFDLRFYVVALIFIIFDVEVAFLFPWATVFGKTNQLIQADAPLVMKADDGTLAYTDRAVASFQELGMRGEIAPVEATIGAAELKAQEGLMLLNKVATFEVLVFFSILLVGFAYVWRMGALDWVRAVAAQQTFSKRQKSPYETSSSEKKTSQESVLSA